MYNKKSVSYIITEQEGFKVLEKQPFFTKLQLSITLAVMFEELLKVNFKSRFICSTTATWIDVFQKRLLKI